MFEIGQNVMVALVSGYSPMILIGRVKRLIGFEGAELEEVTWGYFCPGAAWGRLAAAKTAEEQAAFSPQYKRIDGNRRFPSCRDVQTWEGPLPHATD